MGTARALCLCLLLDGLMLSGTLILLFRMYFLPFLYGLNSDGCFVRAGGLSLVLLPVQLNVTVPIELHFSGPVFPWEAA